LMMTLTLPAAVGITILLCLQRHRPWAEGLSAPDAFTLFPGVMSSYSGRIGRERRTIGAMVTIYCRGKHGGKELCPECDELLSYCNRRLELCPFKEEKPTCLNCSVHCYNAQMRERIRPVMYYSGPRLLFHHPVLAIRHLTDERRKPALRSARVR
jgi:hypothetical protein